MILPTKHIRPDRALLTVGGEVLACLREPLTVSRLWDELRGRRGDIGEPASINYDWFILALDLLFIVKAVELHRGLIRKTVS